MIVCSKHSNGAKILVHPYSYDYNSRLANLLKIAELLANHGHNVTVLLPSNCKPRMNRDVLRVVNWYVPDNLTLTFNLKTLLILEKESGYNEEVRYPKFLKSFCDHLLQSKPVLDKLKAEGFDLLILDVFEACGRILRDYFDIPSILYNNNAYNYMWDVFYPSNYAYVPSAMLFKSSDRMTFLERAQNIAIYLVLNIYNIEYYVPKLMEEIKKKHGVNTTVDVKKSFLKSSITIVNADFAVEFPRPSMPHVIPISGLLYNPGQPLDDELESFIQLPSNRGTVIVTFGSLVPELDEDRANVLAETFSRFPEYKFIWRYTGVKPKMLGSNTKLMDWLPQNDLLAHSRTKLIITHCGHSSSYETVSHGIPVIALPLFVDQFVYAKKLTERLEIGVQLDFYTAGVDSLTDAIKLVLNDPKYKENALKAQELVHDQPTAATDKLFYWVDYVIRHRGPMHLHSQAAYDLSWYQYFLLDVIACIVFVVLIIILVFIIISCVIFRCIKSRCSAVKKQKIS